MILSFNRGKREHLPLKVYNSGMTLELAIIHRLYSHLNHLTPLLLGPEELKVTEDDEDNIIIKNIGTTLPSTLN